MKGLCRVIGVAGDASCSPVCRSTFVNGGRFNTVLSCFTLCWSTTLAMTTQGTKVCI